MFAPVAMESLSVAYTSLTSTVEGILVLGHLTSEFQSAAASWVKNMVWCE